MSVFDKNGMLLRQDQIEIKRQENAILSGPGNDNQKAMKIDALYQARGLQPGSFYREDFDQAGSGENLEHHEPATRGEMKFFAWLGLFGIIWILSNHYFPYQTEWVWEVLRSIIQAIFGLIGMIIGWILKL